jgi:hypothetical protein
MKLREFNIKDYKAIELQFHNSLVTNKFNFESVDIKAAELYTEIFMALYPIRLYCSLEVMSK